MKIYLNLVDKEIEIEGGTETQIQTAIDIIQERFIDFQPRIAKRTRITSAQLFKKMMDQEEG